MKIFKHRHFHYWAKSENLTDESLKKAVATMLKSGSLIEVK